MSDRDRILEYLEQHGSVTSYEIRVKALSGNPSQRITELQDLGYSIESEPFTRNGRPCTRYRLADFRGTIDGHDVTAPDPTPGAGGSSPFSSPPSAPVSHSSADSCRTPGGKGAGGSLETSPLQLFESPDAAYVDADQRVA